jgi:hypothetical protein
MAQRVVHQLIDDIDGKHADESLTFGLDGVQYQIDLSSTNAQRLRDAIAPYAAAGTRIGRDGAAVTRRGRSGGAPGATRVEDRKRSRAIRAWAQSQGLDVPDHGRLRHDIIGRYDAETGR